MTVAINTAYVDTPRGVSACADIAYAKVNLALHVRARRPDGYHELESLFVFCGHGDGLQAQIRDDGALTLVVGGPFSAALGAAGDNLVLRAARALQATAGITAGAALVLDKRLPIAAGIGSGSADAAAALRLLVRLWGVDISAVDLFAIAESLGADVPACLGSTTVFGTGVGERLSTVDLDLAGASILLVNPLVSCPTGPVFRQWDGVDRGALSPQAWADGRNDLQPPAMARVPEIGAVLDALRHVPGVTMARMSGSGATCFALFEGEDARDAAEVTIRAVHPGWWTLASSIR